MSSYYQPRLLILMVSDITTLSQRLCAPVGGFGTSLLATLSALSTKQYSISTTPTIPPGVTDQPAVSSILATATPAPNLGNPADLSTYPQCAVSSSLLSSKFFIRDLLVDQQYCNNNTVAIGGNPIGTPAGNTSDLTVACGPRFRSLTAGCEAAICNATDYQKTQLLAQQLCGSYYKQNATLSASVASAVASQTAIAKAATEGKDPMQLSNYPACAILYLAEKLCVPVGGILTHPYNNAGSNGTTNGTTMGTSVPFTGEGNHLTNGFAGAVVAAGALAVGILML
ncbi:MAG: hypothetical protein LQ350_006910 [Teloschistes chrysophthalmus]|nr:MAG: hypothetical protein LQ350_006910 [Niorma chrysophthalma]